MSETVHYIGTLKEVEKLKGETLEEQCKRILDKKLEEYYNSYQEMLLDEYYKKYVICNNILYSVEMKDATYNDVFNMSYNLDGTIRFEVKYYDGGCSFIEAIETAFNNYSESF